jgi:hypothetical protein
VPLRCVGDDPGQAGRKIVELDLEDGQGEGRLRRTQQRHLELAPVEELLDQGGLPVALDQRAGGAAQRRLVRHHALDVDAMAGVLARGLHDQGRREARQRLVAALQHRAARDRHPARGQQRARHRLVEGLGQRLRRRARIGQADPVEQRRDAGLPARVAVDRFDQLEGHVGLLALQIGEQATRVAAHADPGHAPTQLETGRSDPVRHLAHAEHGARVVGNAVRERGVVAGEQGDPARHLLLPGARHSRA